MSLIPSESASFSDLLGRGLDGSRKSKWRVSDGDEEEAAPEPVKETLRTPRAAKVASEKIRAAKKIPTPRKSQPANHLPATEPAPETEKISSKVDSAPPGNPDAPKRSRLAALVSAVSKAAVAPGSSPVTKTDLAPSALIPKQSVETPLPDVIPKAPIAPAAKTPVPNAPRPNGFKNLAQPAAPEPARVAPGKPAVAPASSQEAAANDLILKILQANSPPPSAEPYRFVPSAKVPAPEADEPPPSAPIDPPDPFLADLFAPQAQTAAPASPVVPQPSASISPTNPAPALAPLPQIFATPQPAVPPQPTVEFPSAPAAPAPLKDLPVQKFVTPSAPPALTPAPVQHFDPPEVKPRSRPAPVEFVPPMPEHEQAESEHRPIPIVRRARSVQNPKGEPIAAIRLPAPARQHPGEGRVRPNISLRPKVDHNAAAQFPPPPMVQAAEARDADVGWLPCETVNENSFEEFQPRWEDEPLPAQRKVWRRALDFDWQSRLVRFVTFELVAILILVVSALIGIRHRMPDDPMNLLTKLVLIASAVVAVVIPVLFYGMPERFPRGDR